MQPIDVTSPELSSLDETELRRMAAAGDAMIRAQRQLSKAGHNLVERVLEGGDVPKETMNPAQHFPAGDVFDYETGSQYYFHAHEDRSDEYGHFHLFLREQALPLGAEPVCTAGSGDTSIAHLVAVSMDRMGRPMSLFTTNAWVTSEDFYPATDLLKALSRFRVDHTHPCLAVNQWLTAAVQFFGPQIRELVTARDAALEPLGSESEASESGLEFVLQDRSIDVITRTPISFEGQMSEILAVLATFEPS